jgi:hypothetical protein
LSPTMPPTDMPTLLPSEGPTEAPTTKPPSPGPTRVPHVCALAHPHGQPYRSPLWCTPTPSLIDIVSSGPVGYSR